MSGTRQPRADTVARQARALDLLMLGQPVHAIAEELRVHRKTIWEWLQDPDFAAALRERQERVSTEVFNVLVAGAVDVALALRGIALNTEARDRDRVAAGTLFFNLLGRHKGNPVQPPEDQGEAETEEDAIELLAEYPTPLLQEALRRQQRQRDL